MPERIQLAGCPRIFPWLVLCAVVAVCIDLGHFHGLHTGDSLLPIFCSLYKWTPFFWEQNRFGSLLPALALPFRDPFTNLLVQCGFGIFFSLTTFFLLPRYLLRDATWPNVGLLGAIGFLACTPEFYRFEFMSGQQPYFTSLTLGLGGLIVLEKPCRRLRFAIGLGLLVLTHWVNLGAFVVLGPLALARGLLLDGEPRVQGDAVPDERGWLRRWLSSESGRQLVFLGISAIAGIVLAQMSCCRATRLSLAPWSEWPTAWLRMVRGTWKVLAMEKGPSWPEVLAAAAGLGLFWAFVRGDAATRSRCFRACLVMGTAGLINALAFGSLDWMRVNEWQCRYWLPTIILLQGGLVIWAVVPWLPRLGARAQGNFRLAASVTLFITAFAMYGRPSLEAVHDDLNRQMGAHTEDILSAGCTHMIGDYWDVWPAVFHANLTLHERGDSRVIWAIAHRASPTRRYWLSCPVDQMRIARTLHPLYPLQAKESLEFALSYAPKLPALVEIERRSTISILQPEPADLSGTPLTRSERRSE